MPWFGLNFCKNLMGSAIYLRGIGLQMKPWSCLWTVQEMLCWAVGHTSVVIEFSIVGQVVGKIPKF